MRLRLLVASFLLVPLVLLGTRALAQSCPGGSTSTSCTGGGNGNSGSEGGGGGTGKDDGPDPTAAPTAPPAPAPAPQAPAAPQTGSGGGGDTTSTAPVRSGPTGGTTSDRGGTAATDAQVLQWATHFQTTPDEVKSWFVSSTPNDTIGGEGSGLVVHPGDEMTVTNDGAVKDGAAAAGFMDFRGGDGVDISLHSARVPLGSATTDSNGVFTSSVKIPDNTKLGRHFIVALSLNTKQGKIAFVFPINVVTPEPVFNAPAAAPTATHHSSRWLFIELVLGTATIGGLVLFRVRRAAAARP